MESQRFLNFWGLKSLPWNELVPIERLFWQEQTQTLCARLRLSMQKAGRLFVIVAPPGHGKSTLARWIYHAQGSKSNEIALFSLLQQEERSGWLMKKLASYLGLPGADHARTLQTLHETYGKGRILTVVIDNAHQLAEPEAFDEVLSLSQIQAISPCQINFVLIGNPRLQGTLNRMPENQHRVTMIGEIQAFNRTELQTYISQRMQDMNISRRAMAPEALTLFAQQGILTFATADALLEACLFEAFMREQKLIDADIVGFALDSLGVRRPKEEMEPARVSRQPQGSSQKRRPNPSSGPNRTVSSSAAGGAGDLNSLYYKSTGTQDNED